MILASSVLWLKKSLVTEEVLRRWRRSPLQKRRKPLPESEEADQTSEEELLSALEIISVDEIISAELEKISNRSVRGRRSLAQRFSLSAVSRQNVSSALFSLSLVLD